MKKNIVAFSLMLSLLIVPANAARTLDDVYNSLNYANQSAAYYLYRAERALDQANLHLNNIFTYFGTLLLRLDNYHVDLKSWLTYNNLGIGSWLYNIFTVESRVNTEVQQINSTLEQFAGEFQPTLLPGDYQQLEYVRGGVLSAGRSYLITDVYPGPGFGYDVTGAISSSTSWHYVFGAAPHYPPTSFPIVGIQVRTSPSGFQYSQWVDDFTGVRIFLKQDSFPEQRYTLSLRDVALSDTFSVPITLFTLNQSNQVGQWGGFSDIYDISFYNSTGLYRRYIPARRLSDGVVGFYELVTGSFKPSDGPAGFQGGPVKTSWANTVINRLDTIIDKLDPQLDSELQSTVTESVDGARGLQRGFGSVTSGVFGQMGSVGGTISDTFSGSGDGSAWFLYDVPYELMDPEGGG